MHTITPVAKSNIARRCYPSARTGLGKSARTRYHAESDSVSRTQATQYFGITPNSTAQYLGITPNLTTQDTQHHGLGITPSGIRLLGDGSGPPDAAAAAALHGTSESRRSDTQGSQSIGHTGLGHTVDRTHSRSDTQPIGHTADRTHRAHRDIRVTPIGHTGLTGTSESRRSDSQGSQGHPSHADRTHRAHRLTVAGPPALSSRPPGTAGRRQPGPARRPRCRPALRVTGVAQSGSSSLPQR